MPTRDEIATFSLMIEDLANTLKVNYHEAILHYCENTELELEVAATLVSPTLKAKIREQAESVNMLKKTCRLPI